MRPLVINDQVRAQIAEAIKKAEQHPVPIAFLMTAGIEDKPNVSLADRKPGFERPASELVIIPFGYHVAYSIEEQPIGLCGHLSISVDKPGMTPAPEAVVMIAEEYGIKFPSKMTKFWVEEFDPGHHAINLVSPRNKPS